MSEVFSVKGFEVGEPYQAYTKEAASVGEPHLDLIAALLNTEGACFVSSSGVRKPFKSIIFSETTMSVFFRILENDELHTEPIITYQNHVVYSDVFQLQQDDASLRVCAFNAFIPYDADVCTLGFETMEVSDGIIVHVAESALEFKGQAPVPESLVYRDCLVMKQAITMLKYLLPKPESDTKIKWVGSRHNHKGARNVIVTYKTPVTGGLLDNKAIDSLIYSIVRMDDAVGYILKCVQNPVTPPDTCLTYNQVLAIIYAVITGAENQALQDLLYEVQNQFAISSFNMYLLRLSNF